MVEQFAVISGVHGIAPLLHCLLCTHSISTLLSTVIHARIVYIYHPLHRHISQLSPFASHSAHI